jgi:hypothetical protein
MRPSKTELHFKQLIRFGFLLTILVQAALANATDVSIFEMRKSLPMNPGEPAVHDYYINAGSEAGLKKDMYAKVVRSTSVQDPGQNRAQGTLHIAIANVQLIQVEKNISVARLYSELSDDERPAVEFEAIMLGDRIDMDSVTMDEPKIKHRKKTAEAEILKPQVIAMEIQAVPAETAISGPPTVTPPAVAVNTSSNTSAPAVAQVAPPAPIASTAAAAPNKAVVQPKAVIPVAGGKGVAAQAIVPPAPEKSAKLPASAKAKADEVNDEEDTASESASAALTADPALALPQIENNAPAIQVAPVPKAQAKPKVEKKTTAGLEALGNVPSTAADREQVTAKNTQVE